MNNFGRTEKTILSAAVIILLFASYFLYDDSLLFPTAGQSQNEPIGDVSASQNDVRRKNSDAFSWYPATKKDSVFQHDSIFTGEGSSASVRLKDGSVIEIQPNSLVTLNVKDGQMTLDLRYGNLVGEVTQSSSLIIQSGGEEFKLQGESSKVAFNRSRGGTTDVKLLRGKADVISKTGKVPTSTPAEKPDVILETPNGLSVLKTQEPKPVHLSWKSKGRIAKYEVEVSKDPEFKDAFSTSTVENDLALAEELTPGTYSWRVKAYDLAGKIIKTTEAHTFTLSLGTPPTITSPTSESVIALEMPVAKNETPAADTKITWSSEESSYKSFHFQIAKDPEFKELVKNVNTPLRESQTPKLPSGVYYARVRANIDNGLKSEWSSPVAFTLNLTAQKPKELPAPILITTQIKFKAGEKDSRLPSAINAPVVEWKPVSQAKAYRLQIDKDKAFSQPQEFNIKDTRASWGQHRPGKFYYRVYSVDAKGNQSVPSAVGEMMVSTDPPVLAKVPPVKKRAQLDQKTAPPPENINVSWSEAPLAKAYLLEMDTSDKFEKPTQYKFNSTAGVIQLPTSGHYYLRVQALGEEAQVISDYSPPEEAIYNFAAFALTRPAPKEPFDKASIFLQQEVAPFIWLEWKSVDGAKKYRIEVSSTPDFNRKIVSQTTDKSRFLLKEKLPIGPVFWRVRAEGGDENLDSDWSDKREFMLYHKKNETFVK